MMSDPVKWTARMLTTSPPGMPTPPEMEDMELDSPSVVMEFIDHGIQQFGFGPEDMVRKIIAHIEAADNGGPDRVADMMELDLREKFLLVPMPGSSMFEMMKLIDGLDVRIEVTPVYAEGDRNWSPATLEELMAEAPAMVSDIENFLKDLE